jgi:hypothetical protein
MAVTNFSPLLGLALPTTGDLSGTWGTTVNDSITSLIDSAVAGTTTLSANADVTLSTTNGAANQARNAVILWTASNGATTRTVTAPAQSKAYVVINAGTGSVIIKGSGTVSPYNGVTVPSGTKSLIAWNGSDFVKVVSNPVVLTTDVSGTLPIANGGTGTTSTTFTNLATNVTGTLPIANGGTGTTSTTFANLATNVTGTLPVVNGGTGTTTPALVAGTNVTISGTWPNQTINSTGGGPGGGTVTSVGMTVPTFLSVAGSPVTTSGTLAVSLSGTALPIANGGTGTTSTTFANLTTNVTGTLPVANGGTGTTTPSLVQGSNITITGTWPNQTIATASSGGFSSMDVFTSSGTWSVPSGITKCKVTVTGAGGGANNAQSGGGGAGGTAISYLTLSGSTAAVTIGAGTSGNGGNSTFVYSATTLTGNGGGAGTDVNSVGGTGGSASGGTINIEGGGGQGASVSGGVGGSSFWGGGGHTSRNVEGANGQAYGSGAGGRSSTGGGNYNGQSGVVTIEY